MARGGRAAECTNGLASRTEREGEREKERNRHEPMYIREKMRNKSE
jgi:hypothetical protein